MWRAFKHVFLDKFSANFKSNEPPSRSSQQKLYFENMIGFGPQYLKMGERASFENLNFKFKFQPFAIIVNHYYYHNNKNPFETIQRPLSHVLVFHPFIVHRAALGTRERGPICAIYTAFTP